MIRKLRRLLLAYVRLYVFRTCPRCKLRDPGCRVCDDFAHRYPGQRPTMETLKLWQAYYQYHSRA